MLKRMSLAAAFAAAVLGSGGAVAQAPATAAAAGPIPASQVPIETFFRRGQFPLYLMSPDRKKLATIAPMNGRDNLVVIDLEKRARINITNFNQYDVTASDVAWITNDRLFFRVVDGRDVAGNSSYKGSYAVNVDGTGIRNLDSLRGTPAGSRLLRVIDRKTGDMIIEANLRRREAVDLYKVNTTSGTIELLTFDSPANTLSFWLDAKNVPRLALTSDRKVSNDYEVWFRVDDKSPWTKIQTLRQGGEYWYPLAFEVSGTKLFVSSNIGRDRKAIYEYDLTTQKLGRLIVEHPLIDLGDPWGDFANASAGRAANPLITVSDPANPDDPPRIVGWRANTDKLETVWFDPEFQKLQATLDAALPGRINTFGTEIALGKRGIVRSVSVDSPPRAYIFDPEKRSLEQLPTSRPWLDNVVMPERRFVKYTARDGLEIPGFLTVPRGSAGQKLPLIVNIHGGPYLRNYDLLGWNGWQEARFFASRGYAVLEPEPRGSMGFGRKLFRGGWGTWGQEMQNDITDGVKHLIAQGIVDPDRVCLYGGSYGGYATLQGLIREPDMFRCGLSFVAVTDLELFQNTTWSDIPVEYKSMQEWFAERVGDPKRDAARIAANSPLRNADKIKAPVLLIMGQEDVRVPLVHGTRMRDAMRRANVPHEFHVYVGEGHGWNKDENVYDFFRRAEAFFATHLKPRP